MQPLQLLIPSRTSSPRPPPLIQYPLHAFHFVLLQFCTGGIYVIVSWFIPQLNVDIHHRSVSRWYNDCIILALLSLSTFSIAGHYRFFYRAPPCFQKKPMMYNLALYMLSPLCCVGFGLLNNVQWLHNSVSSSSAWKPPAVYVYGGAFVIILLLLFRSIMMACRCPRRVLVCQGYGWLLPARVRSRLSLTAREQEVGPMNPRPVPGSTTTLVVTEHDRPAFELGQCHGWSEVFILCILVCVMFIIPWCLNTFHPHHYQIAYMVTWWCTRNTVFDRVCMWLSLSIMVHGIIAYGAAPIGDV